MRREGTLEIADQLEGIVQDLMSDNTVPLRERSWANCSQWDSLFQLNLITAIEQEFRTQLTDEDAADLTSFEAAVHIVEDQLDARRRAAATFQ
jgi:acyl carrier protein